MEQITAYQYKAINDVSYNALAAYVTNIVANVSLFPEKQTIVVEGKSAYNVGKFIDDQGLDFHINPIEVHDENLGEVINNETTDPGTLRSIIIRLLEDKAHTAERHDSVISEITRDRDIARKDRDMYMRWYTESNQQADRVKGQIQAISVLIDSIYPKQS